MTRTIRARAAADSARSWLTEAPLRMLMNNLDPEVAERPEDLVVYGGIGKAARNWECFDRCLCPQETRRRRVLAGSVRKAGGRLKTHPDAPRVLIANSNLVPNWANWEHFNELDRKGLMMYGQMTAGSWIYIGRQGSCRAPTRPSPGRAPALRRRLVGQMDLTAGLGGMGGAQPLAATMAGASMIAIECDPSRIEMRLKSGYLDAHARSLEEAKKILSETRRPISIGLVGNAAELVPEFLTHARTSGFKPSLVTDQTSAHDPANGYLPERWSLEKWKDLRKNEPDEVALSARESLADHVQAILGFSDGHPCVDYGNNIRQETKNAGVKKASTSRIRPRLFRPVLHRQGALPVGCAIGRSAGHREDRREGARALSRRSRSAALARPCVKENTFPRPARAHLLAGPRAAASRRARLQRNGEERTAQGADRHRSRPSRCRLRGEPQPRDRSDARGSDAVSYWALSTPSQLRERRPGVLITRRGRMGYSQHADCHRLRRHRRRAAAIERVLWNDPASGVMRHAMPLRAGLAARATGSELPF